MNRRQMLQAGAGLAVAGRAACAEEFADTRLRVGVIGCGWYGKCDLFRLLQVAPVRVVALCDVDRAMLAEAAELVVARTPGAPPPRTCTDYRQMLRERDLDVVIIGTPDHWHALQTIAAIEAGAHVYVQKPISVDVAEGAAMLAAARRHRRVVQVGTQRRSTAHLVEARDEFIRGGLLGKVAHAEVYCYYPMRTRDNPPDEPPPPHLDWELWTGPAPLRPYNRLAHPRGWRAFMEYGNGIVGDMCIHMLDMVRWLLDLRWPTRVSSTGGILVDAASKANITDTQVATFEFDGLAVVWQHRTWGHPADPQYPWGATLYGEMGTLRLSVHRYDFEPLGSGRRRSREVTLELDRYPEDRTERDLERHVAPAIRAHMADFLRAIRDGSRPVADIEEGHISTASCILANHAMVLGRTLTWDAGRGRVANDSAANALLRRPYRRPWRHPAEARERPA